MTREAMLRDLKKTLDTLEPTWAALRIQDYETWVILDKARQVLCCTIRRLQGATE